MWGELMSHPEDQLTCISFFRLAPASLMQIKFGSREADEHSAVPEAGAHSL